MNEQRDDSINFRVQPRVPSKSSILRPLLWVVAAIAIVSTTLAILELKQVTLLQHDKTQLGSDLANIQSDLTKAQNDLRIAQSAKEQADKNSTALQNKLDEANALILDLKGKLAKKTPPPSSQAQSQGNQGGTKPPQKPPDPARKK